MALIRANTNGGGETAKDTYMFLCSAQSNCAYGDYTFGTQLSKTDSNRVIAVINFAEPTNISYSSNTNVVRYFADGTVTKDSSTSGTANNVIAVGAFTSGTLTITVSKV